MQYYININSLGGNEQACLEIDCCRDTFWNRDIEITAVFYNDLKKHKEVMLIPELHEHGGLVFNFKNFFEKTIEFTVVQESISIDRCTLFCELNAYFLSDSLDDKSF